MRIWLERAHTARGKGLGQMGALSAQENHVKGLPRKLACERLLHCAGDHALIRQFGGGGGHVGRNINTRDSVMGGVGKKCSCE